MGRRLDGHVQRVVGIAQVAAWTLVEPAGDGVGAGGEHGVDRVPAAAEQAALRPAGIERDPEGEHPAVPDQPGGGDDVLGADMVQRADLVVLAPAAPILELLGGVIDRRATLGDIHVVPPSLGGTLAGA